MSGATTGYAFPEKARDSAQPHGAESLAGWCQRGAQFP